MSIISASAKGIVSENCQCKLCDRSFTFTGVPGIASALLPRVVLFCNQQLGYQPKKKSGVPVWNKQGICLALL